MAVQEEYRHPAPGQLSTYPPFPQKKKNQKENDYYYYYYDTFSEKPRR